MKHFTSADVKPSSSWDGEIAADLKDLIFDPPAWMKMGLQETASGYGKRLNSGYKISFNGRKYRVYVCIFSNSGTSYFITKKKRIVVD